MTSDHTDAWNEFWRQNGKAGHGRAGCLPARWEGIDRAQRTVWEGFAAKLPSGARVLDLATGDGRVMAWMHNARRDLKLTGTDLAPDLPQPPPGTKIKPGVAMESLPFSAARFASVTSQFGFEYGDPHAVAAEIARVLLPGGLVGLLSHRGDGPILAHNLRRRAAIRWAVEEKDLIGTAKRSLGLRASGISVVPGFVAAAPAEGARLFGEGSAAWEIAEAVRQTLTFGKRDSAAAVAGLLDTIAARADNELMRISSLAEACAQADDTERLDRAFAAAQLETIQTRAVSEAARSPPFASFRLLRRA